MSASILPTRPSVSGRRGADHRGARDWQRRPSNSRSRARQRLAAPAHSHDHYEETIYGIDGVLTWTVDYKPIEVGPGQALCIPRGAVHRFDNHGTQEAKALCVITPAAIGPQFFRESAAVINAAAGGPPDRAKMTEIMRRHGLAPAPAGSSVTLWGVRVGPVAITPRGLVAYPMSQMGHFRPINDVCATSAFRQIATRLLHYGK